MSKKPRKKKDGGGASTPKRRKSSAVAKRALAVRVRHLARQLSGKKAATLERPAFDRLMGELKQRERELRSLS